MSLQAAPLLSGRQQQPSCNSRPAASAAKPLLLLIAAPAPTPMLSSMQGMEQDHLIELSLRHADKSKIAQIKAAALNKAKQKVHGHSHGHKKVHQHNKA